MRKILAAFGVVAALASPAAAQDLPQTVRIGGQYTSLGYCQLTSLASAASLSSCSGGIPGRAVFAELCSEGVALRYRDDGVAPTSGVGMPISTNTCFQYNGPLASFQVIQGAVSGILDVTFYR